MRNIVIVAVVLALASAALAGQNGTPKPEAPKPIAAIAWLVGGVWTADTSQMSPFRAQDMQGKEADMRVQVLRKSNDDYTWTLEEKEGANWKQLLRLEYLRTAGE